MVFFLSIDIIYYIFTLFPLHHLQQSRDPYFLTTVVFPDGAVNELTRLKLAVFDVRDREKEEVLYIGNLNSIENQYTTRDVSV